MSRNAMNVRVGSDSLGECRLPRDCLHGISTFRGARNFSISHRLLRDEPAFVRAMVAIKRSAALARRARGATVRQRGASVWCLQLSRCAGPRSSPQLCEHINDDTIACRSA